MARKAKRDLTMEEQLARGPMDLPFLMLVMLLVGIGLIMVFSASYASAYYDAKVGNNPLFYIKRQAMFAVVGVVVMYLVSKINYQTFRILSIPLLIVAIGLLVLVLTPLGVEINGAQRWLKMALVAGPTYQPSEIAKIAVIIFFAARLSKREVHQPYPHGPDAEPAGACGLPGAGALRTGAWCGTGPGAAGAPHVRNHPGHGGSRLGAFCGGDQPGLVHRGGQRRRRRPDLHHSQYPVYDPAH